MDTDFDLMIVDICRMASATIYRRLDLGGEIRQDRFRAGGISVLTEGVYLLLCSVGGDGKVGLKCKKSLVLVQYSYSTRSIDLYNGRLGGANIVVVRQTARSSK